MDTIVLETKEGVRVYGLANPAHIQQLLIETIVRELPGEKGWCPSTAKSRARTT